MFKIKQKTFSRIMYKLLWIFRNVQAYFETFKYWICRSNFWLIPGSRQKDSIVQMDSVLLGGQDYPL